MQMETIEPPQISNFGILPPCFALFTMDGRKPVSCCAVVHPKGTSPDGLYDAQLQLKPSEGAAVRPTLIPAEKRLGSLLAPTILTLGAAQAYSSILLAQAQAESAGTDLAAGGSDMSALIAAADMDAAAAAGVGSGAGQALSALAAAMAGAGSAASGPSSGEPFAGSSGGAPSAGRDRSAARGDRLGAGDLCPDEQEATDTTTAEAQSAHRARRLDCRGITHPEQPA